MSDSNETFNTIDVNLPFKVASHPLRRLGKSGMYEVFDSTGAVVATCANFKVALQMVMSSNAIYDLLAASKRSKRICNYVIASSDEDTAHVQEARQALALITEATTTANALLQPVREI